MPWWESQATRIERKLGLAIDLLHMVLRKVDKIMAKVDDVLAEAEAAAQANSDAEDAAMALLTSLAQAIADLKAAGTDPATVARIKALADGLNAKAAALAAAIVANTPTA